MNLVTAVANVYNWTLKARWRTWLSHSLLALALAPVFGAWTVMVFFLLREIGQAVESAAMQLAFTRQNPPTIDWEDHFLDFMAPFAVLLLSTFWPGW